MTQPNYSFSDHEMINEYTTFKYERSNRNRIQSSFIAEIWNYSWRIRKWCIWEADQDQDSLLFEN